YLNGSIPQTLRNPLIFRGFRAVYGVFRLAVRDASTAEDPLDSSTEDQIQQGDDEHHDGHEHQHHERVVDQFLAGGCDDLLQFANNLADKKCNSSEEAGIGLL